MERGPITKIGAKEPTNRRGLCIPNYFHTPVSRPKITHHLQNLKNNTINCIIASRVINGFSFSFRINGKVKLREMTLFHFLLQNIGLHIIPPKMWVTSLVNCRSFSIIAEYYF